jgi:hypothetical protein
MDNAMSQPQEAPRRGRKPKSGDNSKSTGAPPEYLNCIMGGDGNPAISHTYHDEDSAIMATLQSGERYFYRRYAIQYDKQPDHSVRVSAVPAP